MVLWMKIIIIIMIMIVATLMYWRLHADYHKQKEAVLKLKVQIRQRKAIFNIEEYRDKNVYCKSPSWLLQRNRGMHPCDLKRDIKLRDYSCGCEYIVIKKGL